MAIHARQTALIVSLTILILPAILSAQPARPGTQGFEFWGGYSAWSGDDVEDFDPAWQVGVALLRGSSQSLGFGIEGLVGRFNTPSADSAWEFGLNALFRWTLGSRDRPYPFLQGRFGWHRISAEVTGLNLRQDGLSLGPEFGLVIPVAGRSGIVLAVGGNWLSYGNATLFTSPTSGPGVVDNRGNAIRFGGRVGWLMGGRP